MKITKVSVTSRQKKAESIESIAIEYEDDSGNELSLKCYSQPAAPEFYECMRQLTRHVVRICEFPESDIEKIKVSGVSISYSGEDETMGVVFTAAKELKNTDAHFQIVTPKKIEGGEMGNELYDSAVKDVNAFLKQAEEYVEGKREQTELFQYEKSEGGNDPETDESEYHGE